MTNKTMLLTATLLMGLCATTLAAEARNYMPQETTVYRLAQNAEVVLVGKLDRVENIQLSEPGMDAAANKRLDDGTRQDGVEYIRREGVLTVSEVLKGQSFVNNNELRFVSIRQLQLANYDEDLKTGNCLFFLSRRHQDSRFVVLSDERGTVSATEAGGSITTAVDLLRPYIDGAYNKALIKDSLIAAIDLSGNRLSTDGALELSWHHGEYASLLNEDNKQNIMNLMTLSNVGSVERNQLITAVGRHKPEGGFDALFNLMLDDASWSTTSLGAMSLEYIDRGLAIQRLLDTWADTLSNDKKLVVVRALGLIRPKAGHDGLELRNRTLNLINELLVATTNKDLLREALIASRDLRAEGSHVAAIKDMLDNRDTNGLTHNEIRACIVALAAARKVVTAEDGTKKSAVLERGYLNNLASQEPVLKQVVDSALKFPWTTLIVGADQKGH